jgi:hypothetical protein
MRAWPVVAVVIWCGLLHEVFEHTWTYGQRTFACILVLAALVAGVSRITRRASRLRLPPSRAANVLLASFVVAATLVFTAFHVAALHSHLFGRNSSVPIVDVGLNTSCAAERLFDHGEDPYAHPCQVKSVAGAAHVHVDARGTTMYGVPYEYGYPYFPVMFASYDPFREWTGSYRSILYGNLFFYAATILGIGWLARRLAPSREAAWAALLSVAAYSCVLGLGREIFYAGHTDGVIAAYALFGFIAATYGRHRTAGALFGLALAAKLLPGAIFASVLVAWYWPRPERWRFVGALAAVVAAFTVPFAIWNGAAFLSATILFYLTLHASGDDTALWHFLPEWAHVPFTLAGVAGMACLFVKQAGATGSSVRDLLRTCVLLDLVLLAFSRMMHLNYLLAVLPLGAVALVTDAVPESRSDTTRSAGPGTVAT